jgi:hypothetical protein
MVPLADCTAVCLPASMCITKGLRRRDLDCTSLRISLLSSRLIKIEPGANINFAGLLSRYTPLQSHSDRMISYEVQSRMAVFYAAASLSGAFSGLLAFGIEKMDGIGG